METVYQSAFPGLGEEQVAGDVVDKCRAMLLDDPGTRSNYKYAYIQYLTRFCGLDRVLGSRYVAFLNWFLSGDVPDYRTVSNRIQELIKADASLQPPRDVMERRQQQRRQGRVR